MSDDDCKEKCCAFLCFAFLVLYIIVTFWQLIIIVFVIVVLVILAFWIYGLISDRPTKTKHYKDSVQQEWTASHPYDHEVYGKQHLEDEYEEAPKRGSRTYIDPNGHRRYSDSEEPPREISRRVSRTTGLSVEETIEEILHQKPKYTRNEILTMIREKRSELGLETITDEVAVNIVVAELDVVLSPKRGRPSKTETPRRVSRTTMLSLAETIEIILKHKSEYERNDILTMIQEKRNELGPEYIDDVSAALIVARELGVKLDSMSGRSSERETPRKVSKTYIDPNGYRRYSNSDILVHRHIAEIYVIRRKLREDEDVHHINGNKLDNRSANLRVMTWEEHRDLHERQWK